MTSIFLYWSKLLDCYLIVGCFMKISTLIPWILPVISKYRLLGIQELNVALLDLKGILVAVI